MLAAPLLRCRGAFYQTRCCASWLAAAANGRLQDGLSGAEPMPWRGGGMMGFPGMRRAQPILRSHDTQVP